MHLGLFIASLLRGNVHVLISQVSLPVGGLFKWGCTEMRSPGIGMVLHLQPDDLHIVYTNPKLFYCIQSGEKIIIFWLNIDISGYIHMSIDAK